MAITFKSVLVDDAPPVTSRDFTGLDLPAGLICVVGVVGHSSSQGPVDCVINGVAATKRITSNALSGGGGSFAQICIFTAVNPTANASGTIRLSWSNGVGGIAQRVAMAYWSLPDFEVTPHDTALHGATSDPINCTIDVPANGVVIAAAHDPHGTAATGITWTNAVEQFDTAYESRRFGGAHQIYATAQTNLVVSADFAGTTNLPQGAAISFASSLPVLSGTMATVEAADAATMAGTVKSSGIVGATDVRDTAAMVGTVTGNSGLMIATEAPDTAHVVAIKSNDTYTQSVQPYIGDEPVGFRKENSDLLVLTDQEFDITAERDWKPADFRNGTLSIYLGSHNVGEPFQGHWDTTSLRVTYVLPPERNGTLDAVEGDDVAVFVIENALIEGALAAAEDDDVAAFVGALVAGGALAAIETADVAAFAGRVVASGVLAASDAPDAAAFQGAVATACVLAAVEGADAAAFAGVVARAVILQATEAADVAAFMGAGFSLSGNLVAVEQADAALVAGGVVAEGILATSGGPDEASFTGGIITAGTVAAVEAPDVPAITGTVARAGSLAATEAADAAALVGKMATQGPLAAIEASDLASFVGEGLAVKGPLLAVEAPDVPAFAGAVITKGMVAAVDGADAAAFTGEAAPILGAVAAAEAADTAAMVGQVVSGGQLIATESDDAAAITGAVATDIVLVAAEAPDVAVIAGAIFVRGALAATEAPDEVYFFETSIAGFFAALEASDNAIIVATGGDYAVDIIGDEDPHTIKGGCEGVSTIIGNACTPTIKGSV